MADHGRITRKRSPALSAQGVCVCMCGYMYVSVCVCTSALCIVYSILCVQVIMYRGLYVLCMHACIVKYNSKCYPAWASRTEGVHAVRIITVGHLLGQNAKCWLKTHSDLTHTMPLNGLEKTSMGLPWIWLDLNITKRNCRAFESC